MSTYVSPTAALINSTGISAPPLATVLAYLQSQWQATYGSDVVLSAATQDGQFLGVLAQAASDANAAAINAYQSFSPATGQGVALSQNVALNGLERLVPTQSIAAVTLTGTVNTVIPNGVLTDTGGGYRWDLPASVTIGSSGTVSVNAVCETVGAIPALANTITGMAAGLTNGWQSVTNPAAASPGAPVELDGALRVRQGISTTLPSLGVMDGIVGAILACPGVTACTGYANSTGSTNSYGMPAGSICFVVQGGTSTQIASAIATKKTPGVPTFGTTSVSIPVPWETGGIVIYYIVPTVTTIKVAITLHALTSYSSTIGVEIQNAVAAYINSLGINATIMIPRLYVPASLAGSFAAPISPLDATSYELVSIQLATTGSFAATDIAVGFSALPNCLTSNISITLV